MQKKKMGCNTRQLAGTFNLDASDGTFMLLKNLIRI